MGIERDNDALSVDDAIPSDVSGRPTGKRTSRVSERRALRDARPTAGQATRSRTTEPEAATRRNPFKQVIKFFKEVIAELRKVIWPNRKQMVTYTTVVLVFLAVMVALIGGLDFGFIKGVTWLFG